MKARDLRIYAWMLFVLFFFFIGFSNFLIIILSKGWSVTVAGLATIFSFYFFEEFYQKREKKNE